MLFYGEDKTSLLLAQENHCDPNLKQAPSNPNGYRLRGDRCEGEYIGEMSGSARVVSLVESVEEFNPAVNSPLLVEWVPFGNATVHLQVHAFRRKFYYQMDSIRPEGSTSYTWPSDILSVFNLKSKELGFVAWVSHKVGNTRREVFLPLRIRQKPAITRSGSYTAKLLPNAELDQVFVSLALVTQDGRDGTFLKKDEELKPGYYPKEQAIPIPLPPLKIKGIYHLQIGVTFKSGGSTVAEVWFYHPND
jgi:hypothetical protein